MKVLCPVHAGQVTLTEGRISGEEVLSVLANARDMLNAEVRLLMGQGSRRRAGSPLPAHGDHQGRCSGANAQLLRSGLADAFAMMEVVGSKTYDDYARLPAKHNIAAERFLMAGNC